MSNALSIAAVTAVIKDLLENGLVTDAIATSIGDVIVTALPPDRISVEGDERPQINLFLYSVDRGTTYTIPIESSAKDTDSITIPIANIKAGNYLVRVQVDGVESWLSSDEAGTYAAQQVNIS